MVRFLEMTVMEKIHLLMFRLGDGFSENEGGSLCSAIEPHTKTTD